MSVYLQLIVGLGAVFLLGFAVKPLVDRAKKDAPLSPPAEPLKDQWTALTGGNEAGCIIGTLERFFYFGAFWASEPSAIAVWLAFKVASKWEAWKIVALPESLPGADQMSYLIARRRWGSHILITFLVGTLANVLVGFLAVVIARNGYEAVCALFS